MPERILDRVPTEYQSKADSQRLLQELLEADPSLGSKGNEELLDEVHGLIIYNNFMAEKYNSAERVKVRAMSRDLAGANIAKVECVDGRGGGKQQDDCPTHAEPGGLTMRTPRHNKNSRNESAGDRIPRSAFLRGGIQKAAHDRRDLIEFTEGHFMEEPPKDAHGKHISRYETCGQILAMLANGEIQDTNLIRGHIGKINEITGRSITTWYNDWLELLGRDPVLRAHLTVMKDTVTRGIILDLDQTEQRSPLSVPELVRINRGRIESNLGKLVGGYGDKANWLIDPERSTDAAMVRYLITRGLMKEDNLRPFRDEVLTYFSYHYPDLTEQQRIGALFKFADNAALVYSQGSAYGEAEHPYKWHNERCMVLSPEGNPPFVFFPDVQSFVATPPEPERTLTYAKTMINIWNEHHEEAKHENPNNRMPDRILMFLATSVSGDLGTENDNFVKASNISGELFHHKVNDEELGNLYWDRKLDIFSLLYDYQTRIIRSVVNNRAIANR